MKKILCFAIAFFLSFGCLTGCGDTSNGDYVDDGITATEATTTTTSAITTTATEAATTTETVLNKQSQAANVYDDITPPNVNKTNTISDLIDFNESFFAYVGNDSEGRLKYIWFTKYIGKKDIKYYHIYYSFFNSVDDPAYDESNNHGLKSTISGPVYTGNFLVDGMHIDDGFECKQCAKLQIDKIELEYFDETKDVVEVGWSCEEMVHDNRNVELYGEKLFAYVLSEFPDYLSFLLSNYES